MRPSTSRLLAGGLALTVLLSGCGTPPVRVEEPTPDAPEEALEEPVVFSDDQAATDRDEWMKDYAEEVNRIRAATTSTVALDPDPDPGAPEPAQDALPTDEQGMGQLVQQARAHAALVDQRLALLVESFIDEGLARMEQGDLEGAHEQFAHAFELDPLNPLARRLHAETGSLLGDERAELSSVTDNARSLERVRRGQKRLLVSHNIEQGRLDMAADNPEAALRHFEDALALLRFNPEVAADDVSEADIQALIEAARHAIHQAQAQREADLLAQARPSARRSSSSPRRTGSPSGSRASCARPTRPSCATTTRPASRPSTSSCGSTPSHEEGNNLRRIATRARYERDSQDIRRVYRDEWVSTFEDLQHDTVVPNNLLEFPDNKTWAEIEDRGPRSFAARYNQKSEADQAIIDRLNEVRIPIDFQGADLSDVLDHLSRVSGINFLMSPDVQDEVPNNIYDVTDRASQPISRVLEIILQDLSVPEMTYTVRDGVVRVITLEESPGDYILEMYDIRTSPSRPPTTPRRTSTCCRRARTRRASPRASRTRSPCPW